MNMAPDEDENGNVRDIHPLRSPLLDVDQQGLSDICKEDFYNTKKTIKMV